MLDRQVKADIQAKKAGESRLARVEMLGRATISASEYFYAFMSGGKNGN